MAQRYLFGPFELDAGRGVLTREGAPIALGNRALSVLQALLAAQGGVVTKAELLAAAWPGTVVEESNLAVQVAGLRRILGAAPGARDWIATASRVGYRFTGPLRVEPSAPQAAAGAPASDLGGKPSIAVLPFANLGGEAEQDYFVDGITEDIIAALSRFRWFFVIGRNSSFALKGRNIGAREVARELGVRYVLEGSARRAGERIRIAAALDDAASASRIWAERFDFAPGDLFSVQDRIVQQVAGAIEPELLKTEARLAFARSRGASLGAWDLVRQGVHEFHKVGRDTHLRARELFREAIARDPEQADGHTWLARVSAGLAAYGWSENVEADLREGVAAAFEAIRRDAQSPYSHYALAITSAYAGESAQAMRAAERALELNPSFALGYLVLGMARLFAGDAAGAVAPFERGLGLNPHDPQNFVWYTLLAFARYFAGDPAQALEAIERATSIRPASRPALELAACCHHALGRAERAAGSLAQSRRLPPPADRLLEPLKKAGDLWRKGIEAKLVELGACARA